MTRLAAFFLVLLALVLGMDRSLGLYDEGVILTGAMRAAAGDIPHAGFYTNYGPGVFYPIAILFAVRRNRVIERLYDTAMRAGIVIGLFLVAEVASRRTPRWRWPPRRSFGCWASASTAIRSFR